MANNRDRGKKSNIDREIRNTYNRVRKNKGRDAKYKRKTARLVNIFK